MAGYVYVCISFCYHLERSTEIEQNNPTRTKTNLCYSTLVNFGKSCDSCPNFTRYSEL